MSSYITEAIKLRNIEKNLTKGENAYLERLEQLEGCNFAELIQQYENVRKTEADKVHNKIANIYLPLNKIRGKLKDTELDTIDLKEFKEEMILLQNNKQNLQKESKQNLDILGKEETDLQAEIELLEQNIEEWCKPVNPPNALLEVKRKTDTSVNNLCQEAKDFLDFTTKSGGHENGWSNEDHCLFLKTRSKSKNPQQVAEYLHKILPDISEEEILRHENWYQTYTTLKEKKRAAIQAWKKNKAITDHKKQTSASVPLSKVKTRFPAKNNNREQLIAWKLQKDEKLQRETEIKQQHQMKQKQFTEEKRKKNEELKREIEEWKNVKLSKAYSEKLEIEMAEKRERELRAAHANKLIKEFQSQDDTYIQRKRQILQHRAASVDRSVTKKSTNRDPGRLLKPTEQWLSRTRQVANELQVLRNIQHIEKLGQPEWRKGLH